MILTHSGLLPREKPSESKGDDSHRVHKKLQIAGVYLFCLMLLQFSPPGLVLAQDCLQSLNGKSGTRGLS